MKPTLEDLCRSAEFCGYECTRMNAGGNIDAVIVRHPDRPKWPITWCPQDNAEQDRELLHKLLEAGYTVVFNEERGNKMIHSCFYIHPEILRRDIVLRSDCHPNDFLTLAASKLQEQRDD